MKGSLNSFDSEQSLLVAGKIYRYYSLSAFAKNSGMDISRLPFSLKILLENLLRREDGVTVKREDIEALAGWDSQATPDREIQFMPARVLLQDFTGVPAVADLAAMRRALQRLGGDPGRINPLQPADLVIDHSVQVDRFGTTLALEENAQLDYHRNHERYQFLRWGQGAFKNFRVVPPATGICHQVNLEYLSRVAMVVGNEGSDSWIYPDTVIGTDSHTTMINGLGVVGWGVGGIEAEAALLGQPCSMLIPQVVGFRISGRLNPGVSATDLVLTVTQMLRKKGVVGSFVEFFGPGVAGLTVADRATIGNMSPEYGATIGVFPVDSQTTDYLRLTGREGLVAVVESYYRDQGIWHEANQPEAGYSSLMELDLGSVEPCLAGPSRPQDRIPLAGVSAAFEKELARIAGAAASLPQGAPSPLAPELAAAGPAPGQVPVRQPDGTSYNLSHGSVVIAAITSCTNTSNPSVLFAAALLARNAVQRGLQVKPWVKTSLAPGSKVVTDYLVASGLMSYLEALRFHLVGYGCTTCIGNSGPLPDHIAQAVTSGDLCVASVLSGNRNFEGRINSFIKANYLASPPLVVAYALAGNVSMDLNSTPLGLDTGGQPVYLRDILPGDGEVAELVARFVTPAQFKSNYAEVFAGDPLWNALETPTGELYQWQEDSTYLKEPPFLAEVQAEPEPLVEIRGARALALLGDSVTTDHISPAGSIGKGSPAGKYLISLGVAPEEFNSYGARRGNHEVMVRGTFANIRIKNRLVPGVEGGVTVHFPAGGGTAEQLPIYDAAMRYRDEGVPLIVIAGKEYGTGSSRDWAAKGTRLLGVRAVLAESFERIHRSNLVGMGILPLQFLPGESCTSLGLTGSESFDIGIGALEVGATLEVQVRDAAGAGRVFSARVRIDTPNELEYFQNGGILPYMLRQALKG
jgi:aconitate hydratase